VLQKSLRERLLPSESIVKLTTIVIGAHWHARAGASVHPTIAANEEVASNGKRQARRQEAEEYALEFLLAMLTAIFDVAIGELEEVLGSSAYIARNDTAVADEDAEDMPDVELHLHISAVLRRLLPSLRIISKWTKLHLEYVCRFPFDSDILGSTLPAFWQRYARLIGALARLFPIDQLPSLSDPLEEDIDLRGFIPLSRGLANSAEQRNGSTNGQSENKVVQLHDVHPNEEQLMRIADLQVDAKLLMQTEVSLVASPEWQELISTDRVRSHDRPVYT